MRKSVTCGTVRLGQFWQPSISGNRDVRGSAMATREKIRRVYNNVEAALWATLLAFVIYRDLLDPKPIEATNWLASPNRGTPLCDRPGQFKLDACTSELSTTKPLLLLRPRHIERSASFASPRASCATGTLFKDFAKRVWIDAPPSTSLATPYKSA